MENRMTRMLTSSWMSLPFLSYFTMVVVFCSCSRSPEFKEARERYFTPLHTDLTYLKDEWGRYVHLRGVNVSCSTKNPASTDPLSYVGKPFPEEEADNYFGLLAELGFNAIRLLVIWEAIEPHQRGVYDEAYLEYIRKIVEAAAEHGIYVIIDMHQDLWSRHLMVKYNDEPWYEDASGKVVYPPKGSLEAAFLALVPDEEGNYSDMVKGDGAPRWALQVILPEKDMDSPHWGTLRLLGALDEDTLAQLIDLVIRLMPEGEAPERPSDTSWITAFTERLPPTFSFKESSDLLPWTNWGVNAVLSLDVQRCFATFFAGDKIYPQRQVEGQNLKDYLQEAYIGAYLEVVKRVKDLPNVIGYDLMNEPLGFFGALTAAALLFETGSVNSVRGMLTDLLGPELGEQVYELMTSLGLLPPDATPSTVRRWGFEGANLMAILDLNYGFEQKYLQPFYEKLGRAIQREDPDAIIWIKSPLDASLILGNIGRGFMEINMRRPQGVRQVVYAPHWYPDVYPFIGFNQPPRDFTAEEVSFRDYSEKIKSIFDKSAYSLGNIPVVFAEFGTYFNLGGIKRSREENYAVSAEILNNYYEVFESLFLSNILWCFSPENDYRFGDRWNMENFSILDPEGKVRGMDAFSRPYPRALSGKPVSMHFFSDYHYFDPDKGEVNPLREFELKFESKETSAPTEVFIPPNQYPDGVYVWISDGYIIYDKDLHLLYFFPEVDEPGFVHSLKLLPPLPARENLDWDYFIETSTGRVISGR